MCAWWTGQPIYGSNPASKFVRENFAYIKPLIDLLSGSAVTQADLTKLHAITASAYTIDRLNWQPWIGNLGTLLDTTGNKAVALPFDPSVVIFLETLTGITPYGNFSIGFDNGTNAMSIYQYDDAIQNGITGFSSTRSIFQWRATGTPVRDAYISAKSAAGFTLTVAGAGAVAGAQHFVGTFLALP